MGLYNNIRKSTCPIRHKVVKNCCILPQEYIIYINIWLINLINDCNIPLYKIYLETNKRIILLHIIQYVKSYIDFGHMVVNINDFDKLILTCFCNYLMTHGKYLSLHSYHDTSKIKSNKSYFTNHMNKWIISHVKNNAIINSLEFICNNYNYKNNNLYINGYMNNGITGIHVDSENNKYETNYYALQFKFKESIQYEYWIYPDSKDDINRIPINGELNNTINHAIQLFDELNIYKINSDCNELYLHREIFNVSNFIKLDNILSKNVNNYVSNCFWRNDFYYVQYKYDFLNISMQDKTYDFTKVYNIISNRIKNITHNTLNITGLHLYRCDNNMISKINTLINTCVNLNIVYLDNISPHKKYKYIPKIDLHNHDITIIYSSNTQIKKLKSYGAKNITQLNISLLELPK